MVEQSDRMYGGTCVNVGCVPTKALVHEAENRRDSDDPRRWYTDSIGKVDALTTRLRGINFAMLDTIDAVTVITGHAVFFDAHTVEISAGADRLTVRAESIVIGSGSEPVIPDIPGLRDSSQLVTSTDLIATSALPDRLAVLGGGYLGIEFAAIYRRFGSEVTVLDQAPALFRHEDDDVAADAIGILDEERIKMITGVDVDKVRDTGQGTAVLSYGNARAGMSSKSTWSWPPPGADPQPVNWVWRRRALRPTRTVPSSWTSTCGAASRTYLRSATSTAAHSSPTYRSTTAGSSQTNL